MNVSAPPEYRLHLYRIWDPGTREVYAMPSAWNQELAERTVRDTAAHHPGAAVQVLTGGRWRPWLRVADAADA